MSQLRGCNGFVPPCAGWDLRFPGAGDVRSCQDKGEQEAWKQGSRKEKSQVLKSKRLVIETQTQEGWQGPISILKLPLIPRLALAVFAVEITSPSPTTHR